MKLAFCLLNYFPHGGLQRDFVRIAKECIRRGHSVHVFTMRWEGELIPEFHITLLPPQGIQNHTRVQHFAKQLQPHLKNMDLVIGFNKMPGLDVYYAADTCYQAKARKKHSLFYRLTPRYRHSVNFEQAVFDKNAATKILLISPFQQAEFVRFYQTEASRFYCLPPGIAKDRIAPSNKESIRQTTRATLHVKDDTFLCLLVGSGFKTKGLDRVLEGIAALPADVKNRTQLFVVGKNRPNTFQKQAKKLGILPQVHFLGGRDDVPALLLAADVLLHPAYNENTGTVLLEALVSGLPVLTTDNCGYAHYITESNTGIVLPSPFRQKQFNEALLSMLLSDKRSDWQKNGLAFAKTADIYSMPERAVDVIESIKGHTA